tara:strand:+ start:171 stop:530 length:360 start_codon:yes stop_codon:yes gene_type:complete
MKYHSNYQLSPRMKESFKSIGSFIAYKYSIDSKNFGDFDYTFKIEPFTEFNIIRKKKNLTMIIQDKNNNFTTMLSWKENSLLFMENGLKTFINLSCFSFTLLLELEVQENMEEQENAIN